MKKRMKSKKTKSKRVKTQPSSPLATADQDIVGLLRTLVQKLTSFETKLDTVLSRLPSQPFAAPRQQPAPVSSPERRRDFRPMHKAICADCGKDCEVPFRPSVDRPVYCKGCFTTRKNNGTFRPRGDNRPKEGPPVPVQHPEKQKMAGPATPAKKKRPAATKKKKK
jgi:CxxC-x17-CxxC domain-containing protein